MFTKRRGMYRINRSYATASALVSSAVALGSVWSAAPLVEVGVWSLTTAIMMHFVMHAYTGLRQPVPVVATHRTMRRISGQYGSRRVPH